MRWTPLGTRGGLNILHERLQAEKPSGPALPVSSHTPGAAPWPEISPGSSPDIETVSIPELRTPSGQLSIVIPAYNEEMRIPQTVRAYAEAFAWAQPELLIEVDGSRDRTSAIVREMQVRYPAVKLLEYPERLGKGRGVIEGVRHATGDWVAYVDADGSVSPEEFLKVANAALADGADAVIATRYWDVARMQREHGFLRWTASRSFNVLVRHLYHLPFRDTQCGAKLFRREALDAVLDEMKIDGYAFDVELLWRMKQHGFKVVEVPILWRHKDGSTVYLPRVIYRMFLDILRLRVNP